MNENLYDVLGVSKTATKNEIKKAYRRLANKYHPDKNKDADASDMFKKVHHAYDVLSDDTKRKSYDMFGETNNNSGFNQQGFNKDFGGFSSAGFDDIFKDFFAKSKFQNERQSRDPFNDPHFSHSGGFTRNVEQTLFINIEDAYHGKELDINIDTTSKKIKLIIPPKTKNESKMRLKGKGLNGGDLILVIKFKENPKYEFKDDKLFYIEEIPFIDLVLGCEQIVSPFGRKLKLKIPSCTQNNALFKIPNFGFNQGEPVFIKIQAILPKNINEKDKKLFEELKKV